MISIQLGTVTCIIYLFRLISTSTANNSLQVSDNALQFGIDDNATFTVFASQPVVNNITVWFNYSDGSHIYPLVNNRVIPAGTKGNLIYTVAASKAGHTTIYTHGEPAIETTDAIVTVDVYKAYGWVVMSSVIGWLYFIAWSISGYPQVIENYRRKSVVGFNFDFLALSTTGFIAYAAFNLGLKYSHEIQVEYHSVNPTGVIPVEVNDVVFALHAVFVSFIAVGQCFIYERGDQVISKSTVVLLAVVCLTGAIFLLITALHANKHTPWLTFLYFFSYVKLGVTLIKYIPQVVFNYQRKSTVGWSVWSVLLDFTGGFLSIGQMLIISHNYNDWFALIGNFGKLGLGLVSIAFDVILMTQHFILYRHREDVLIVYPAITKLPRNKLKLTYGSS